MVEVVEVVEEVEEVVEEDDDDEPAPPLFRFRPLSSTRSIASSSSSALSSMLKLSFSVFWLLPFLSILTSSPTMHVSMLPKFSIIILVN